jgi:hypothetical protein
MMDPLLVKELNTYFFQLAAVSQHRSRKTKNLMDKLEGIQGVGTILDMIVMKKIEDPDLELNIENDLAA